MSPSAPLLGCSTFHFRDGQHSLLARNLDTLFTDGYVIANPRGQGRQSFLSASASAFRWVSQHGSLSFNIIGCGLPMGGINETGLVVEHLHMPGTSYPPAQGRPQLLEFEWIQYLLDNCASVGEALAAMEDVAIAPDRIGMHFVLADAAGDCCLVEFRDGGRQIYTADFMARPLLTNDWYTDSQTHLAGLAGFGGNIPLRTDSRESLDRFAILASLYRELAPGLPVGSLRSQAMHMLDAVEHNTILSVLYESAAGRLTYKTRRNPQIRHLAMADFDFSAGTLVLDMHATADAWQPYDETLNLCCMRRTVLAHDEFLRLGALLLPDDGMAPSTTRPLS
jgi:penicillin V acylase-like amidase (Ntn superfamily)